MRLSSLVQFAVLTLLSVACASDETSPEDGAIYLVDVPALLCVPNETLRIQLEKPSNDTFPHMLTVWRTKLAPFNLTFRLVDHENQEILALDTVFLEQLPEESKGKDDVSTVEGTTVRIGYSTSYNWRRSSTRCFGPSGSLECDSQASCSMAAPCDQPLFVGQELARDESEELATATEFKPKEYTGPFVLEVTKITGQSLDICEPSQWEGAADPNWVPPAQLDLFVAITMQPNLSKEETVSGSLGVVGAAISFCCCCTMCIGCCALTSCLESAGRKSAVARATTAHIRDTQASRASGATNFGDGTMVGGRSSQQSAYGGVAKKPSQKASLKCTLDATGGGMAAGSSGAFGAGGEKSPKKVGFAEPGSGVSQPSGPGAAVAPLGSFGGIVVSNVSRDHNAGKVALNQPAGVVIGTPTKESDQPTSPDANPTSIDEVAMEEGTAVAGRACPGCSRGLEWGDSSGDKFALRWQCRYFATCGRAGQANSHRWLCRRCKNDYCSECHQDLPCVSDEPASPSAAPAAVSSGEPPASPPQLKLVEKLEPVAKLMAKEKQSTREEPSAPPAGGAAPGVSNSRAVGPAPGASGKPAAKKPAAKPAAKPNGSAKPAAKEPAARKKFVSGGEPAPPVPEPAARKKFASGGPKEEDASPPASPKGSPRAAQLAGPRLGGSPRAAGPAPGPELGPASKPNGSAKPVARGRLAKKASGDGSPAGGSKERNGGGSPKGSPRNAQAMEPRRSSTELAKEKPRLPAAPLKATSQDPKNQKRGFGSLMSADSSAISSSGLVDTE